MTPDGDGTDEVSADLDDTPEMRRLLTTLKLLPQDKVVRLLERLASEAVIVKAPQPPKGPGDKGE